MSAAVATEGLSKSYGDFRCLVDCNLTVREGIVFGLLGPNGAGKSTLLRTLMGFLSISAGNAKVCGFDVATESLRVRSNCAYLPGDPRLYRAMTGAGVLRLFGGLHPCSSLDGSIEVAERLGLDLSRRVMFMSTGMRQKLAISLVLSSTAPLIILDEPTANLDPTIRSIVLELVREVREEGRTVVLSSHIFSDIDETCDEVAVLRGGRIVTQVPMSEIAKSHIVTGVISPKLVEPLQAACAVVPFVMDCGVQTLGDDTQGLAGDVRQSRVELQLNGDPSEWLNWLAERSIQDMEIERAGIASLYRRYHSSVEGIAVGIAT